MDKKKRMLQMLEKCGADAMTLKRLANSWSDPDEAPEGFNKFDLQRMKNLKKECKEIEEHDTDKIRVLMERSKTTGILFDPQVALMLYDAIYCMDIAVAVLQEIMDTKMKEICKHLRREADTYEILTFCMKGIKTYFTFLDELSNRTEWNMKERCNLDIDIKDMYKEKDIKVISNIYSRMFRDFAKEQEKVRKKYKIEDPEYKEITVNK